MPVIKKRRRKSDFCLNCGTTFKLETNFCPNCGQENNHNVASFGTVVVDFFHNYFSFDSKFSNSLLPFFSKPGRLTRQFIEGKRASFVNPIRLYLILSLVFFFVFSMVSQDFIDKSIDDISNIEKQIPDSTKVKIDESVNLALEELEKDSVAKAAISSFKQDDLNIQFDSLKNSKDDVWGRNFKQYLKIRKDYNLEVDQVIDTLETDSLTEFQVSIMKNMIRLDRSEKEVVISHVLKNLPLMMFILIPIFALVLKLFYVRRNQFYITHLVHALHLHSLAYVVYGLTFLMTMYWFTTDGWSTTLIFFSWVMVCTHSYLSFRKVYQQSWRKTFFKFNIIGLIYFFLLTIGISVELILSVITY